MGNGTGDEPLSDQIVRIATRSSDLAMWQARYVQQLLSELDSSLRVELVSMSTRGDRDQSEPLRQFGGLGVFTREVQSAVLEGRADVAVHSLKDLPTRETPGLILGGFPPRGPVHDVIVLPASAESERPPAAELASDSNDQADRNVLACFAPGARVGTGSPRRQAQLKHLRPDLELREIRGNVGTRLRKLDQGEYDAIMLAEAGLQRLTWSERISLVLQPPHFFPAVGQGALGIECRSDDQRTRALLAEISHPPTRSAVVAERAVLRDLQAGCHAPVGVHAEVAGDDLSLTAVVLSLDGVTRLKASASGLIHEAEPLGSHVAQQLLEIGAAPIIDAKADG